MIDASKIPRVTTSLRLGTILAVVLLAVALPAAAQSFPPDPAVLAIIRQRVEEKRSAGIVVGLVEADGRTRVIVFGNPGPGKRPLDPNTVFEIGSISKVFTSTLVAQLELEGQVTLDGPAQTFLPASLLRPVGLPAGFRESVQVGDRRVELTVKPAALRATPRAVWYGAGVTARVTGP